MGGLVGAPVTAGAGTPGGLVAAVVVAAGSGERLGAGVPKAFVDLDGRPLLAHAVAGVAAAGSVDVLVVVVPLAWLPRAGDVLGQAWPAERRPAVAVGGGADRTASVRRGLHAVPDGVDVVLVHDAARCLAPPALHDLVTATARAGYDGVVPGLPVTDTIKEVDPEPGDPLPVRATPPRDRLRAVQTPQGFRRAVLERAHERAAGAVVTDDAGLVEAIGGTVVVVPGDPAAFKITTVQDLETARLILAARAGVGRA